MIEFALDLLALLEFGLDWTITRISGFLPEILGFLLIVFLILMIRRIRRRRKLKKIAGVKPGETETAAIEQAPAERPAPWHTEETAEIAAAEAETDSEMPEAEPPAPEIEEEEEEEEVGFFGRLKNGLSKTRQSFSRQIESAFSGGGIDEEALEQIEEALITADVGVDTSMELIDRISRAKKSVNDMAAFKNLLKTEMQSFIDYGEPPPSLTKPYVIMVVGVNGVGKTTTIGKLAAKYRSEGKNVVLGAADTFRAAAVEQLEIWAERAGADIVKHRDKADPAAVAYDAVQAGQARNSDIVIIDTAGRLHTKVNLMEQLKKIKRTVSRQIPDAPHEILLVVDATTGQNAISQAKMFHQDMGITGIALTKLDGTAKGGIVIGISHALNIPIRYIGIGEKISDLQPFDPQMFIDALF
ncbi:MAG: signal recognition particle-docking protein FtsY [Desulfobacterales bacterium]